MPWPARAAVAAAAREGGCAQPYPSALAPSTATLALGPTLALTLTVPLILTLSLTAHQVPRYLGYLRLLFEAMGSMPKAEVTLTLTLTLTLTIPNPNHA